MNHYDVYCPKDQTSQLTGTGMNTNWYVNSKS